jgi:hypothetical protein
MERLLATINANQAKSDSDRNANKEEMLRKITAGRKADKEEMLAAIKANEELAARMDAKIGSMKATLTSAIREIKLNRKETVACQEKLEVRLEKDKSASVDTTREVAYDQEIPVEDGEVRSVAEPSKRCRDERNLAAVRRQKKMDGVLDTRCRGKEQERAQRRNGCLKNSVAARRGTTRLAVMARRRILFTETTRNRLIIAVRKGTRRAQVARYNFLPMEETSGNFVDPGNYRSQPTEGRPAMRKWHGPKEFAIGRNHTCDKTGRGTRRLRSLRKGLWTRRVGGTGPEDSSCGSYTASRKIKKWTLWRGQHPRSAKRKRSNESRV